MCQVAFHFPALSWLSGTVPHKQILVWGSGLQETCNPRGTFLCVKQSSTRELNTSLDEGEREGGREGML